MRSIEFALSHVQGGSKSTDIFSFHHLELSLSFQMRNLRLPEVT